MIAQLQASQLFASIDEDLLQYRQLLAVKLNSHVPLVQQVVRHVFSGGKAYRPSLLLLCRRCFDNSSASLSQRQAILLAVATEYIHVATLLHDDVVDSSSLRRGKETVNYAFSNASAVLVGDFIYSRAFELMVESDCSAAIKLFASTTNLIAEGEVRQLMSIGSLSDYPLSDYMRTIESKTASLFATAAKIGAVVAGANTKQQQLLYDYGLNLGMCFQIVDDVLDYRGDMKKMGKHIGDDLLEGKMTLPAILAYADASKTHQQQLQGFAKQPTEAGLTSVVSLINHYKGVEKAMTYASEFQCKALQICQQLPDNEFIKNLARIARFSLRRNY